MDKNLTKELIRRIAMIETRLARLSFPECRKYRGVSAVDFTTTTLPQHGDYGYQSADREIQVNCNGTIRAIATLPLF